MVELRLFDSGIMLGRAKMDKGGSFDTVKDLREVMGRCGIERALVYSALAKDSWPAKGNQALLEMIEGEEGLYPAWVGLPGHTGEFPDGETLKKQAKANRICALRLFPYHHTYPTSDFCCGELFHAMNEMHMPVFLDYGVEHWSEPMPWDEIYRLCRTWPDIPFVLVRVGCGSNRPLFPLLDQCPNLHFELSYFDANRGLESVTKRFGAGRMLFGTGMPIYNPACPIAMLYYADLSDQDKEKIAGENLQKLIGGICYDV